MRKIAIAAHTHRTPNAMRPASADTLSSCTNTKGHTAQRILLSMRKLPPKALSSGTAQIPLPASPETCRQSKPFAYCFGWKDDGLRIKVISVFPWYPSFLKRYKRPKANSRNKCQNKECLWPFCFCVLYPLAFFRQTRAKTCHKERRTLPWWYAPPSMPSIFPKAWNNWLPNIHTQSNAEISSISQKIHLSFSSFCPLLFSIAEKRGLVHGYKKSSQSNFPLRNHIK